MTFYWFSFLIVCFAVVSTADAEPLARESSQPTFFSAPAEAPHHSGILPGTTVDQRNWQIAENLLPQEILHAIQAGDFVVTVQEATDFPVRSAYQTATETYAHQVSLDGGARIEGYLGGRPFPILDVNDPRAGEKAAWNFRYRDLPKTLELRGIMQGINNAGTRDRLNTGRMRVRTGMHRLGDEENDLQWQERGVHIKASFQALAPADQEGNMRIMVIYDNDAVMQEELNYSPQNRRIRKGHANLLARMGGGRYDVLQEEQPPFFFIGYLHEYNWTYKGEHVMLVPGFLRADHVTYGGKNNWYPTVPWELRRVIVLESTPIGTHPYNKRVFYLDAQTYTLLYVLSYDAQGTCLRLSLVVHGHPDFVPGAQGIRLPIPLGATWINFPQDRASQFVAVNPMVNGPDAPQRFDMMELLRKGK